MNAPGRTAPVDLVLDCSGLTFHGPGEWDRLKHGERRRAWRKLHLAVDAGTGEILAFELADSDTADTTMAGRFCCNWRNRRDGVERRQVDLVAPVMTARKDGSFKGRHFTSEVILWALRWYLAFPISYRDLALMLADRGVVVDHTTLFRWVQAYAAKLEQRVRHYLRSCTGSWRVDETYIKVNGAWTYLYRAVDSLGQTIDFLLSARRDAAAAKRFFRKALAQPHTVNPRTITVDKNPAYPRAVADMKRAGELWRFSLLRQCKYLNNIVEQDHRRIKRLVRPGLGFSSLGTARRTLAGYEAMAMIRKGQVYNIGGCDMPAQAAFITELFEVAA